MSITINGSGDINSSGNDIELQSTSTQDVTLALGGGSVGIGTASPTTKGHFYSTTSMDQLSVDGAGAIETGINFKSGGTTYGQIYFNNVSPYDMSVLQQYSTGSLILGTNDTERARIDSSGNFFVGATAAFNNNVDSGVEIRPASLRIGSNQYVDNIMCCTAHTGTKYFLSFYQNGTFVGSITGNGSNTAFNTSSDYRLKENVVDLDGAIDRVKQIPVRQFNFIAKPDRTVDGFLAHEVQAVVPEAVTGTKDGMRTEEYEVTPAVLDDDGNVVTEAVMGTREVPDYQGIDQSKLVPLLTQALKDAITKIEALEARVATLESA